MIIALLKFLDNEKRMLLLEKNFFFSILSIKFVLEILFYILSNVKVSFFKLDFF